MALALVGAVIAATAQKITEWKELLTVVDEHQRTVYYNRESGKPLKGEYRIKRGLDLETVKFKNGMMDGDTAATATASCARRVTMPWGSATDCSRNTMQGARR